MKVKQASVILFDGICNLCCVWVEFLIRNDKEKKFRFASIQSECGIKMLHSVGLNDKMMDSVVYIKANHFYRESSAVLEIIKELGGIWKLFSILKIIPVPIRDKIYQSISKKRYGIFGTRSSCYFPTPENKKRFLT
jgi:predicted DCC family thiol-disulfide oxidoreductase YuxK